MPKIRLRGSTKRRDSPYPIGEIPPEVVVMVGKQIVYQFAVGNQNITGDDFAMIFGNAIKGTYKNSPLGVVDVVSRNCAWSVKTVQNNKPFDTDVLRLISGRNSPDYSFGISDARKDVNATGYAVLTIWNSRLDEALNEYNDLRVIILIRNMHTREFVLFEDEVHRYVPDNYRWIVNSRRNLEGYDKKTGERYFTWQPHGAQFTIHRKVPAAARKFRIAAEVPPVDAEHILKLAGYKNDWIEFKS